MATSSFHREWLKEFKDMGAFWSHSADSEESHVILPNGMHSDRYFNWSAVAQHPYLAQRVADELAELASEKLGSMSANVTRIIGSGIGASTLAHCIAMYWPNTHPQSQTECRSGFTEKQKNVSMSLSRFDVSSEIVLPCKTTITSGHSMMRSIAAIREAEGKVVPVIATVFNWSGQSELAGFDIVALINVGMRAWTPRECPLCKSGSQVIQPEVKGNWKKLLKH